MIIDIKNSDAKKLLDFLNNENNHIFNNIIHELELELDLQESLKEDGNN